MRAWSSVLTASKKARTSSSLRCAAAVAWKPSRLVTAAAVLMSRTLGLVGFGVQDLCSARALALGYRSRAAPAPLLPGRRRGAPFRPGRRAPVHLPAVAEQPDPEAR